MTQTSTQTRCTGFVPELSRDPLGHGDQPIPGGTARPIALLQPHVGEALDQGEIPSCATNAFAGAIAQRMRIQGTVDAALPSRAFLYRAARCIQADSRHNLPAGGVRFSEVARAIESYGMPDEKHDPYEPGEIARNPDRDSTMTAYRHAWDQHGLVKMRPCDPFNVEAHLVAGHTLVTGFEIDGAFHGASRAEAWELRDRTGDYHAVRIVGYEPGGLIIANSWGATWGDDGLGLVTRTTVERGMGVWAIEWAPSYSENRGGL